MPNTIGPTGLTTATRDELVAQYTAALEAIYGPDIVLTPDSPDGQLINIFIQSILDNSDLLTQIYNQFDPDLAFGEVLDQRVAINGIQRQAGTFTITDVTITTSQALTLYGLDQSAQTVFTVADNAGNNWKLISTVSPAVPGTYVYSFRAENPGAVLTVPNTITVPVTIVLGVSSINNPTTYTTLGLNEESDATLKIRRQKSVSLASQGFLSGLLAALENINGITSAFVYENTSGSPNIDGVPGHSIWVIVAGTAPDADIANAIYQKRNAGCGMFGAQTYAITQPDGSSFIIFWDVVVTEDVYIKFTATSLNGTTAPNIQAMLDQLPIVFAPGVFEEININHLATLVQQIDSNTLVTNDGFSLTLGGAYTPTLTPSAKNKQFAVSAAKIIILPILISPPAPTILATATQQFTSYGGYGAVTWSFVTNVSGGTISPSGFYTAGATPGVDVIKVTDSDSNFSTANVTVV